MSNSGSDFLIVAAIDFGTTYSGYAYSFRSDFQKDPLRILANTVWKNEGDGTYKTPTTILFDERGNFHSFGYEAEEKYTSLAGENEEESDEEDDEDDDDKQREEETDEYKKWYYFRRFKMELYRQYNATESVRGRRTRNKRITEEMKLRDDTGKTMPAIDVFAAAIRYLKEHFHRTLRERLTTEGSGQVGSGRGEDIISEQQIKWVLTVPAIWSAQAKQFMRRAANKAGILDPQLTIALEPEAASIFCRHLAVLGNPDFKGHVSTFSPGHKFLVVDCGGGTVDITAHEVCRDESLRELHHPTGGAAGGTNVDKNFFDYLKFIFTDEVYRSFSEKDPQARLYLERAFEGKKRRIGEEETEEITISDMGTLISTHQQMFPEIKLSKRLEDIGDKKMVRVFKKTKLRFNSTFLKDKMFSGPVNSMLSVLDELFRQKEISDINTVLLVGGFSDSRVIRDEMRRYFPTKTFLHPPEASLAVLKGAVLFGHSTKEKPQISSRRSDMTYGICTNEPFDKTKHKEAYKQCIDGEYKCTDIFKVMVKKNAEIIPGKSKFEQEFNPSSSATVTGNVEIYQSTSANPMYVNEEGCSQIGNLQVSIPPSFKGGKRTVKVIMHFGDTELHVTAVGAERCDVKLDLLSRR